MRLICKSAYRSGHGTWAPGDDVDVSDAEAEFLLRDSPGSFKRPGAPPESVAEEVVIVPAETTAMSTETQTGLVAPDRRARGGKKRGTGK
jgi:hypothetical protein